MLSIHRVSTVTAIVLWAKDWGEKDRLLALLTKERGAVRVIAQGAQRPANRLAPVAQTGILATFWLAKARDLDRVTDYHILLLPRRLRRSILALTAFSLVAESLELAMPEGIRETGVFEEAVWFLEQLEAGISLPEWLVTALVRFLKHLGVAPQLTCCVSCKSAIEQETVAFSPSAGGILCPQCAQRGPTDREMYAAALLRNLHDLWQQPDLMKTLRLPLSFRQQALHLLRYYWRYHLEVDAKAWRVWQQVARSPFFLTTQT